MEVEERRLRHGDGGREEGGGDAWKQWMVGGAAENGEKRRREVERRRWRLAMRWVGKMMVVAERRAEEAVVRTCRRGGRGRRPMEEEGP